MKSPHAAVLGLHAGKSSVSCDDAMPSIRRYHGQSREAEQY
jgi:hypothetical protein